LKIGDQRLAYEFGRTSPKIQKIALRRPIDFALSRLDPNQGMAESKSDQFACSINSCLNSINKLDGVSERAGVGSGRELAGHFLRD